MLNILRESSRIDRLRDYTIELDGNAIGNIANGENKSFDVNPGIHILCLRIDWARSKKIEFESKNNQTIRFKCANSMHGRTVLLAIIYATILRTKYIKIERFEGDG